MPARRLVLTVAALAAVSAGAVLACSDDEAAPASVDAGVEAAVAETGARCDAVPEPTCTAAKCTAEAGEPAQCIGGACVKVKTADCQRIAGDFSGGNVIVLGALLAQNGANGGSGAARINSLELALKEINAAGGIGDPDPCKPSRTLALVACDDANLVGDAGPDAGPDADAGMAIDRIRAARHLIDDLKVPVIVGGSTSGATLDIAKNATMPAKVMQFAPSSTAIAITTPADFNASPDGTRLLWRAAPSDVAQSAALQKLFLQLEDQVKAAGTPTPRLALVTKNDAYGKGIESAFRNGLVVAGSPIPNANFIGIVYKTTPTDADGVEQAQAAADLTAFAPNIVVMAGTSEATTNILAAYEVPGAPTKPLYLLADGQKKPELTTLLDGKSEIDREDLRKRLRGTQPGVLTPLGQTFFNFTYKAAHGNESVLSYGMAGSYDIGYMLAYAIAATNGGPVDGTTIAKNMGLLTGGTGVLDVGPSSLPRGFESMRTGEKVDFNGASGALDFDVATGEAPSDYGVWCVKVDPNSSKTTFEEATGLSYDAKAQKVSGTYSCP